MPNNDWVDLPPIYRLYTALTRIAAPLLHSMARKKLARAGVAKNRRDERAGLTNTKRPLGRLAWIHAVSVGETLSILDLIVELRRQAPHLTILLTTTTATAAEIAEKRLPEGCIHQFAPLDTQIATDRFLEYWNPNLVAFVESEIWPYQINAVTERELPLTLVNARLSQKSLATWEKRTHLASALFGRFSIILCQSDRVRDQLRGFVNTPWNVITTGDLKKSSDPLPVNELELARISKQIGDRPVWLASSTHQGEEEIICHAHRRFVAAHPNGVLVLLPRHPERGDEIARLLRNEGWSVAQRSLGQTVDASTQVYLADTLGETGLFYSLISLVFVGGSFVPVGGHNPYEPAHLGCAILHGPLFANFEQAYKDMADQEAAIQVEDGLELGNKLVELWGDDEIVLYQANAKHYIEKNRNIRQDVAQHLLALIPQK